MNIGTNLKRIRLSLDKTQKEIAEQGGFRQGIYANWENNRFVPGADSLIKLADCFGCSVDDILGRESKDDNIIQSNNITNLTTPQNKPAINFAERLKTIRKENGMTQMQVSEKSGLSQSNINTWERGRSLPLADGLIALANCFNCSIDYLLGHESQNEAIIINLTQEEESLLKYFREIDKETKQTIIKMLKGIVNG